ncbi:MAG: carbon-nitrogen family hydrolase [Synergistaceae bacterium]
MSLLRVGVIQTDVKIGDREGNYARLEALLEQKYVSSDLETVMVLPEIWDVGYAISEPGFYGDPEAREAAKFLGGLAKKYNCWFAGGSVLALTDDGAMNRAMVITPEGKYTASYDKAHLFALMNEDKFLRAGSSRTLFDIGDIRCGLSVCYDLRFCEWFRLYAVEGAEVLFISAQWPMPRIAHWRTLLQARAIENIMYVVACNRCGQTGKTVFGGNSMVIAPDGEILVELGEEETLVFTEFDTEKVSCERSFLRTLELRRPELYREKLIEN